MFPCCDVISNGGDGQTKQGLAVQHQLCKKVQTLQSLLSPLPSYATVKHRPCLLTEKKNKRTQALETKCMRKLLRIFYLKHKTNNWVRSKINFLVGPREHPVTTVKILKLAWFGNVPRHDKQSRVILQGTLEGGLRRGRQRKCCVDNIKKGGHPAHAIPCSRKGLLQTRLEEDLCLIALHVPPTTQSAKGLN